MPFRHVAMIKFKPEVSSGQIAAADAALRGLPAQIPEIESYQIGYDLGLSSATYDYVIVADFADEAAWRTYVTHPAHQTVLADFTSPIAADTVRVQYRFD